MRMLLIFLSVMTWTVETKNTVAGDGDIPAGTTAEYACSYQKGQVRQGDNATLTLSSLGGVTIEEVTVSLKSNKNSGGGVFTVSVNGTQVASLDGNMWFWTGTYDNANYHDITLLSQPATGAEELVIRLDGTANSLFIGKYAITYSVPEPYAVTLMDGTGKVTELRAGKNRQGVQLPSLPDREGWRFLGWTENEYWMVYEAPEYYRAGSLYIPDEDCTLWALYETKPAEEETVFVTDLQSDIYLYANRISGMALAGVPENGRMDYEPLDFASENQYYSIDFVTSDTAYITHVQTGTPIGYEGTKMRAYPSPWLVYHEGDETIFYTLAGTKKYVLWLNVMGSDNTLYAGLQPVTNLSSPMGLCLPQPRTCVYAYTCHPECGMGTTEVQKTDVRCTKELRGGRVIIRAGEREYDLSGTLIQNNGR